MTDQLAALEQELARKASSVRTEPELEALRADFLARKGGRLSQIMSAVGKLPKEERAEFGRRANETKERIEAEFARAAARLHDAVLESELARTYDVTFPGIAPNTGSLHVLRHTLNDVAEFFRRRGQSSLSGGR